MRRHTAPRRRRNQAGMALVIALFATTALLMVSASGFLVGSSGIRATRNYRAASQVHLVAESGIAHAVQVVNGPGVIDMRGDVINRWTTIFGTGVRTFAPNARYSYSVSSLIDPNNLVNGALFVATATGSEGSRNVVVARVNRSNIPSVSPGAVYLAQNGQTNSTFNGNSFRIDGNDKNFSNGLAGPMPPIPGLTTRTDGNTQEAIASLNTNQRHDVTGLGYAVGPPVVPSVWTSPMGPSVEAVNQFVNDLLARVGVVTYSGNQINGGSVPTGWCNGGNGQICTPIPEITYFNGSDFTVKGNGNARGAGIMIVEGDLTIQGTLDFHGLVIVRGRTRVVGTTDATGHARVWGSLWTNDINMVVGGDAFVQYSSEALTLANLVQGGAALPAPVQVTALIDCGQVPSGTNGCP